MIIGSFGDFNAAQTPYCKRQYSRCIRLNRGRGRRALRACTLRYQACRRQHHFNGADEFGAADPSFIMATGTVPMWNHRDPRAQLTNVAAMTAQQAHPSMNGAGLGGFSLWAWLRGER